MQLKLSGYHSPILGEVISPDIMAQMIQILLDFIKATESTKNKFQEETVSSINGGRETEYLCKGMKMDPYLLQRSKLTKARCGSSHL